jgi:DNA recombination-dependent growth factor C
VPATVVRAYETPAYEPLLLVVRAARYSWNTFKLLLTARDGKVLPADVVKTSFESFQQVSVADAQQLARLINGREAQAAKTAAA